MSRRLKVGEEVYLVPDWTTEPRPTSPTAVHIHCGTCDLGMYVAGWTPATVIGEISTLHQAQHILEGAQAFLAEGT